MSRLAVLGAGKIGEALLSGLLRAGRPVEDMTVVVRRAERAKELEERYGVRAVPAAEAAGADVLLVTVKPQDIEGLVSELAPHVQRSSLVVSLCAGIPTALLRRTGWPRRPGGAGHVQHPGAGRRGDERDLGRRARRGASTWR